MDQTMVLILDHDLGFVCWLAEIFDEAGCQVVPAFDYSQAVSIIEKFSLTVDVVVTNAGLISVQQVLSALGNQGKRTKVVAIPDDGGKPIRTIQADAILKRPSPSHALSRHEMLKQVQEILRKIR